MGRPEPPPLAARSEAIKLQLTCHNLTDTHTSRPPELQDPTSVTGLPIATCYCSGNLHRTPAKQGSGVRYVVVFFFFVYVFQRDLPLRLTASPPDRPIRHSALG